MNHEQRVSVAFLLASVLFTCSGALGLGYQLVWVKKAALMVGTSQIALSTVVTSFFLGLGLGSLFVGRHLRSRRWSPLFVYGLFEAAIGIFALLFPRLFVGIEFVYAAAYPLFEGSASGLFGLRFLLLFVLFLVPTFFMGGTLPLLLDGLVRRDQSVGHQTSLLYGLNILGAVFGVLLTGYYAIPVLGMNGTSVAAGFGNLAIAGVALLLFRSAPPVDSEAHADSGGPGPAAIYVAMAFVSGLAAIGYQMAWARYFGLFNTSNVYLTAILLATYLAALALGSMLLAWGLRRGVSPMRVLAVVQPLIPLAVFSCLELWLAGRYRYFNLGPPETFDLMASWAFASRIADETLFAPLYQVALVLFLPVVLMGTGLPAIIAAATARSAALRANSGSLVFWNTLGSSAGGFTAAYLMIPAFGLTGAFLVLGALSLAVGVAAGWLYAREPGAGPRRLVPSGVAVALGLCACLVASRYDFTLRILDRDMTNLPKHGMERIDLVEGPLATAYVYRDSDATKIGAGNVWLAIAQHWTPSGQALQGHLPALLYPREGTPRNVLAIALGSGQSFGAQLLYPIEHMDVVDISEEMTNLSLKWFDRYNHGLANDPRVTFHLDDGRHFVDRAPADTYDIVSMEPPPPTAEGVYTLYSYEFYRAIDRVLRDGGVLMQWLPLALVTPEDARAMVKTQAAVFPYTFVVLQSKREAVIMSFKGDEPPRWHRAWIEERLAVFATERMVDGQKWLPESRFPMASFEALVSQLVTDPEDVAHMETPTLHHDDDQRLAYSSGDRELLRRYEGTDVLARLSFAPMPRTSVAQIQQYFAEPLPIEDIVAEKRILLYDYFDDPGPEMHARLLADYEAAEDPAKRARAAIFIAAAYDQTMKKPEALLWVQRAIEADPTGSDPELIAVVRTIALNGAGIFLPELRSWLDALPPDLRDSSLLVRAMQEQIEAHEARVADRNARYLFE